MLIYILVINTAQASVTIDVKCTVYNYNRSVNGNDVDVRFLVLGLQENSNYSAQIIPDHNPPTTVTAKTDSDGILWAIAKIPNGEKSTWFKVKVYEAKGIDDRLVASGDDDAPCHNIVFRPEIPK